MRVILVRHAATSWNQERRIQGGGSDTELSEMGKKQAQILAQLLKGENIVAIYSSPQKRAIDTAKAIAQNYPIEVTIVFGLREIDVGEFEGIPLASLGTSFDQFLVEWRQPDGSANLPGGESLTDLADRVWAVMENIREKHCDGVVVVVSHYFALLTIICRALGLSLSHLGRLRVSVGGISILDFEDKKSRLVVLNDTCHLERI